MSYQCYVPWTEPPHPSTIPPTTPACVSELQKSGSRWKRSPLQTIRQQVIHVLNPSGFTFLKIPCTGDRTNCSRMYFLRRLTCWNHFKVLANLNSLFAPAPEFPPLNVIVSPENFKGGETPGQPLCTWHPSAWAQVFTPAPCKLEEGWSTFQDVQALTALQDREKEDKNSSKMCQTSYFLSNVKPYPVHFWKVCLSSLCLHHRFMDRWNLSPTSTWVKLRNKLQ